MMQLSGVTRISLYRARSLSKTVYLQYYQFAANSALSSEKVPSSRDLRMREARLR